MLMQVDCLKEIISSVPNQIRRFRVENELMGIDPDKITAAKTFQGSILSDKNGQDFDPESPCHLVDLFYQDGFSVTTVITDELLCALFKKPLVEPKKLERKGID